MSLFLVLLALSATPSACDETTFIASQRAARAEISTKMEADLNSIETLLGRRNAIRARLVELDSMPSAKRRFKSTFNEDYDPRILRGRDERLGLQIDGLKDELSFLVGKTKALDSELKEYALRCAPEDTNAAN